MVAGKKKVVNVFDFNSKKWEENYPGIPEHLYSQSSYLSLSSTITFDKDAKQKLMVLITSKFFFIKSGCLQHVSIKHNSVFLFY